MPDLEELLIQTSRTFALSIPHLPEPTRSEVTIAYLLFRIADTFEDAPGWQRAEKIAALERFRRLLDGPAEEEAADSSQAWRDAVPCAQPGYHELLAQVPYVLDSFFTLAPPAVRLIREHTARTIAGMAGFVARGTDRGELTLTDLEDLRRYCYVVAGIVGELLTELFLLGRPALSPVAAALRRRAALFGEGLQLVNILKDSAADALEGRHYLPAGVPRAEVMALARQDLAQATDYVLDLQGAGAERGMITFNALPVHLAHATLDRVEEAGPGAKVSRPEVFAIVRRLNQALDDNAPAVWHPLPRQMGRTA
ncbi:MAG TPA: squalene/phytoene synthase family protein [Thermoanaerobaculia bacterium]|nr:squalene/phytoene synthase family protein [Thermoanaerobaculia bacterium]